MKKLCGFLLSILVLLSLASCNSEKSAPDPAPPDTCQRPVDDYIRIMTGKGTKAMLERRYLKEAMRTQGIDIGQMWDEYKIARKEIIDELEDTYGKDYRYTYAITREDSWEQTHLEEMTAYLEDTHGIPARRIRDTRKLDVTLSFSGSEGSEEKEMTFYAVKIDERWYLARFF